MFMIRAPFPRAIGTDFSGVLESIGSTEGRVHPHVAYVRSPGTAQESARASASWSKYGDDLALRRMERAGAVITTADQIISELAIDWTSPNGQKLEAVLEYR